MTATVEQVTNHIAKLKKQVEIRDLALKIADNPLFKKLILEEFCVNECARYAQQSADFALSDKERADALAFAQAPGHLRRWLSVQIRMGDTAESEIAQHEDYLVELRNNED